MTHAEGSPGSRRDHEVLGTAEMTSDANARAAREYEPPALVVLGSVEAITQSSRVGSYSDFKGRDSKKPL